MDCDRETPATRERSIWAFGGGKGGTGKTFIVANLAILLARQGRRVIAFDGDLGGANLHTALGIGRPTRSISDFTRGRVARLEEVLCPTAHDNLKVIPGAADDFGGANPNYAIKSKLCKHLRQLDCDFLLIDLGAGTGYNVVDLFLEADVGAVVVTPEPSAVELAYRFTRAAVYRRLKLLAGLPRFEQIVDEVASESVAGNVIRLVEGALERIAALDRAAAERIEGELYLRPIKLFVNMIRDQRDQRLGAQMCDVLNKFYGPPCEGLGALPYDERVPLAERRGEPFVLAYGSSGTAAQFTVALQRMLAVSRDVAEGTQLRLI